LQHSKKIVILSVIAGLVSGACNAGLLALFNSLMRRRGPLDSRIIWTFLALCLLLPASRFLSEFLLQKLGQQALYNMRIGLSRQILDAPLAHLEKLGSHRLLAALTDDISSVTMSILVVPQLCINVAIVIGCLFFMASLAWTLLLVVTVAMAIGIASYQIPILKAQQVFQKARKEGDALLKHFRAITQGTKELKINRHRREAFFADLLQPTAAEFRKHNLVAMSIFAAAGGWGQALLFLVLGFIAVLLPTYHSLDSRTLSGYTIALLYFITPLQVILNVVPNLARANVALKTLESLGLTLASYGSEEPFAGSVPNNDWKSLQMVSVKYGFQRENESETFVLGPIDLEFSPGEIIFITGGNGSGKTTLAKLFTGLYVPDSGELRLDGEPIVSANREAYRSQFAVVFSDFFLFEQMLGFKGAELENRARQYLRLFKLDHKVTIEDGVFSTLELSQGQKKRLALLAAYLEDRPVYLFDEWASDQDPSFKAVFYLQLLPALKANNKTVFVISHDDRYYSVADRVIKLEEGRVASDERNYLAKVSSVEATA
jgi:putative ATP-binding cassette transporter